MTTTKCLVISHQGVVCHAEGRDVGNEFVLHPTPPEHIANSGGFWGPWSVTDSRTGHTWGHGDTPDAALIAARDEGYEAAPIESRPIPKWRDRTAAEAAALARKWLKNP